MFCITTSYDSHFDDKSKIYESKQFTIAGISSLRYVYHFLQPILIFPPKYKNTLSNLCWIAGYVTLLGKWPYQITVLYTIGSFRDQILESLARNDDTLVQMCSRLSSSCDVIPEELQLRFSAMCGDRVEHINRRITNYRKVKIQSCILVSQWLQDAGILLQWFSTFGNIAPFSPAGVINSKITH